MPFLQIHVSKFFSDCFLETDAWFYRSQTGEYLVYYEFVILFGRLHYLSERPLTQPGRAADSQNRSLKDSLVNYRPEGKGASTSLSTSCYICTQPQKEKKNKDSKQIGCFVLRTLPKEAARALNSATFSPKWPPAQIQLGNTKTPQSKDRCIAH